MSKIGKYMPSSLDVSAWNRTYNINGKTVTARILLSEWLPSGALEVTIQTGCAAPDGNIHYQTNPITLIDPRGGSQLESFAENCAKWLQKLVWEKPVVKMYMMEFLKSTGESFHIPCVINIAQPNTFIDPIFIDISGAPRIGGFRPPENMTIELPVYAVRFRLGGKTIETAAISARAGATSVLGGHLLQQATNGDMDILFQLFMSDTVRALSAVARAKRGTVLILGSFSDAGRERLRIIRLALEKDGLTGVKLDDFADIHQQSLFEKMLMFGSVAGFIVCDESLASGHLIELKACSDIGFVTVILRNQGKPVTWMNADIAEERTYLKIFSYDSHSDLETAVGEAVKWAQRKVTERAEYYNGKYPWRNPNVQLG
jgi:hypothetical protein